MQDLAAKLCIKLNFYLHPIGLVTLIQSSSVLAHKHESTNHLVLPTTEEEEKEELPPSWSDSLGLQYDNLFQEMNQTYDSTSCLLAVHRGWKGGIHIQSCGHHMHYDCRSSYCETLRSQLRLVLWAEPMRQSFFVVFLQ